MPPYWLPQVAALRAAGLRRVNVSLDTLQPEKFRRMTKRGELDKVLEGLFAAKSQGFGPIKINAVVERGVNDDEIIDLVEFSRDNGFAMRFIEYMDVGNANQWTSGKMVSKAEILERISARYSLREVGRDQGSAPSVDYEFVDGGRRYRCYRFGDRTLLHKLYAGPAHRGRQNGDLSLLTTGA